MNKRKVLLIEDYWQEVLVRKTTEYYLTEEKYKELLQLHKEKSINITDMSYEELQSLENILEEEHTGQITKEIRDENERCDIQEAGTYLNLTGI